MSRRRKSKPVNSNAVIVLFVSILFLGMGLYSFIYFFMPNNKIVPYYKHYTDLDENQVGVIINAERQSLDTQPLLQGGEIYLPVDFVKKHIDEHILWESELNKVTITTIARVIRVVPGQNTWLVNGREESLPTAFVLNDGMAYLPVSFINSFYHVDVNYNEEYKLVTAELKNKTKTVANVPNNTALRYEPRFKSPSMEKLEAQRVTVFEEQDKFTRVRTEKGLVGFIDTKKLSSYEDILGAEAEPELLPPINKTIDGKVNLLWDLTTNKDATRAQAKNEIPSGVNVLAPTWFTFDEEKLNGDIVELGDQSYVDAAHEKNVQVWGLIADEKNSVASAVLKNSEVRQHVIGQLLDYCAQYSLDGINIDFERISEDIAPDYIQFLREFYPLMREKGLTLSADMYVPTFTRHYNRTEASKVLDFICVMTYDEHTNGSTPAGPVASYNFVEQGIINTRDEVPDNKILMGIPLYSRVWKDDQVIHAYGPKMTRKFFEDKGAQIVWDDELKLNYAEYSVSEGGKAVTYRTWIEDDQSLAEKMFLYSEYKLGGVCTWVRNFETENTFGIISQYIGE